MDTYAVDFETYYDDEISLTKMGYKSYLAHPATDIYLVSIVGSDGKEYCGHPSEAPWSETQDGIYVSHNRSFDAACFDRLKEQGMPLIDPVEWHCTADLGVYIGLPRDLAGAIQKAFGVKPDKSPRGKMKGRIYEDLSEEEQAEMTEYAFNDSRYCLRLWETFSARWPEEERLYSVHTTLMTHRGLCVDLDAVELARQKVAVAITENLNLIPWLDHTTLKGKPIATGSPIQMDIHCRRAGIEPPTTTAKNSPDFLKWLERYSADCPFVAAISRHRSYNRLLRELEKFKRYTVGDRLRYGAKYYGAHTGRWSGDKGLNLYNLTKDKVADVDIRSLFVPSLGKKFVVCDYDQIEAIMLLWLAGDERQLDLVREGMDVYEAHARATMGYTDREPLAVKDPDLRRIAKVRVLALGYGCGAVKLRNFGQTQGIDWTLKEARQIVYDYRDSNTPITDLWDALDRDFRKALNAPSKDPDGKKRRGQFHLELPSGRFLHYFQIRKTYDEFEIELDDGTIEKRERWNYRARTSHDKRSAHTIFHGGKLTENLVQATARDILAPAVVKLEEEGYPVVLHVYDEAVAEVDLDVRPATIVEIMTDIPDWADGCPITATAHEMFCYGKA